MQNTTLEKRAGDLVALWQLVSEADGEITGILDGWMNEIESAFATKAADSYTYRINDLDAEADRLRMRSRDFAAAAKVLENLSESLSSRLKATMRSLSLDEVKGNDYRLKLSKSKPSLKLVESELPPEFFMIVTERVADKDKIRTALEKGEFVPGARFEESFSLRTYVNKGNT